MRKSLIGWIMILLFIASMIALYWVQFHTQQKLINYKAVKKGHVHHILFQSEDQIFWVKKNKEFRWKGDLYDVENMETSDKGVLIECFKDVKEMKLIDKADYLRLIILEIFKKKDWYPTQVFTIPFEKRITGISPIDSYLTQLINASSEIEIPPPEYLFCQV